MSKNWRKQMDTDDEARIVHCGNLDVSTYLPDEVTVGRVTSDRVRYVYFEDGSECIVLGKFCDFVAFKAADYAKRIAAKDAEIRRLKNELARERNQTRYMCLCEECGGYRGEMQP